MMRLTPTANRWLIESLAYTPRGELLAVGNGGLFLWMGEAWRDLGGGARGTGPIAAHPTHRLAAWGMVAPAGGRIAVTDLALGTRIATLGHTWTGTAAPERLAFNAAGTELWAEYSRQRVRWAVGTWREERPDLARPAPYTVQAPGNVAQASFSPVSGFLVVRNADGRVVFREARRRPPVTAIAFTPDGATLFVAQKGRVRRIDAATGTELAAFHWQAGRITALALAPDGLTAAVGTALGTIVVWDI